MYQHYVNQLRPNRGITNENGLKRDRVVNNTRIIIGMNGFIKTVLMSRYN